MHNQLEPTLFTDEPSGNESGSFSIGDRGSTVLPEVHQDGDQIVVRPKGQVRYQSQQLLGRGGMGEVRLTHDHDIGRTVAVKKLLNQSSAQSVARFVEEVRITGQLEHPNIVPIHDVGASDDGSLFFVMKYVEGETLASVIRRLADGDPKTHQQYGFETRLDCFAGVIRALQYAHNKGLLHRDVKPSNIMIGRFGEVMLMDWGLARSTESGPDDHPSSDSSLVGTPAYMSPEQARGELQSMDIRSDLYSAFVVLYELLTAKSYVESGTQVMDTVHAAADRQPPSPFDSVFSSCPGQAAVPTALRHFLRRGLAADPAERFQSTEEVMEAFDVVRSGNCLVYCPTTMIQSTTAQFDRFLDRHPLLGYAVAGLGVAACFSGVLFWISRMM